ncbi:MAG: flagellar basal body rod protein FlgC [Phycisphaeraceae bacterium]|nr:flagellar basal body rod protein FlgC [Phycisphaeraceae bacterium]
MFGSLDISTSGMVVQRVRLTAASANIAGANVLEDQWGNYAPFLRREVVIAAGDPTARTRDGRTLGVHVREVFHNDKALRARYMPDNPHADANGYVMGPDISSVAEQVDAMEASRAYEANVAAAEVTKAMLAQALRLIA